MCLAEPINKVLKKGHVSCYLQSDDDDNDDDEFTVLETRKLGFIFKLCTMKSFLMASFSQLLNYNINARAQPRHTICYMGVCLNSVTSVVHALNQKIRACASIGNMKAVQLYSLNSDNSDKQTCQHDTCQRSQH